MTLRTVLAIAVLVAAGCTDTTISEVPQTVGDTLTYQSQVQTYLGYRCGSLDCHGDMGRPLRLFALRGLRANDGLRDFGLSVDEVGHNLLSIAAFDTLDEAAAQNQLLLKGLATSAGGMAHVGGDVWDSTDAPGYQCLLTWLSGEADSETARAACAFATMQVLPDESAP